MSATADQNCCQATYGKTGKKMSQRPSCVICYDDGKTQFTKNLKVGEVYKKCQPVVESADDPCQVEPMTDPAQKVFGIIMCSRDLSEIPEGEKCPQAILVCAEFDIDLVCWPDTFTPEDKEKIMATHLKPCFSRRLAPCVALPDYLSEDSEKAKG